MNHGHYRVVKLLNQVFGSRA